MTKADVSLSPHTQSGHAFSALCNHQNLELELGPEAREAGQAPSEVDTSKS